MVGHPSPHLPHLIHADDEICDTISFCITRSEELPFTTGTSRLYMANPIIGPPEINFSGSPLRPPAASKAVCNSYQAIHKSCQDS